MTKKTAIIIGSTSLTLSSLAIATKLPSTSVEQNTLKCNSTRLSITIFTCTNMVQQKYIIFTFNYSHKCTKSNYCYIAVVKLNSTHSYWLICGHVANFKMLPSRPHNLSHVVIGWWLFLPYFFDLQFTFPSNLYSLSFLLGSIKITQKKINHFPWDLQ